MNLEAKQSLVHGVLIITFPDHFIYKKIIFSMLKDTLLTFIFFFNSTHASIHGFVHSYHLRHSDGVNGDFEQVFVYFYYCPLSFVFALGNMSDALFLLGHTLQCFWTCYLYCTGNFLPSKAVIKGHTYLNLQLKVAGLFSYV